MYSNKEINEIEYYNIFRYEGINFLNKQCEKIINFICGKCIFNITYEYLVNDSLTCKYLHISLSDSCKIYYLDIICMHDEWFALSFYDCNYMNGSIKYFYKCDQMEGLLDQILVTLKSI